MAKADKRKQGQPATPRTVKATPPAVDLAAVVEQVRQLAESGVASSPEALTTILQPLTSPQRTEVLRTVARDFGGRALDLFLALVRSSDMALRVAAIEALGTVRSARVAEALSELDAADTPRDLRKAARRSLYLLEQAGVAMPQQATPTPPRVVAHPKPIEAYATNIDSGGYRVIWLVAERPSRERTVVEAVLAETDGIERWQSYPILSRTRFAEMLEGARSSPSSRVIPIPPAYWLYLLDEALSSASARGRSAPREYPEMQGWFDDMPRYTQPIIYSRLDALRVENDHGLLERSAELVQTPEVAAWAPEPQQMGPHVEQLVAPVPSTLMLPGSVVEERQERTIKSAAQDFFPPAMLPALRRRLEETAYIFLESGEEGRAYQALAAAIALRNGYPVTLHPLLLALVQFSLMMALRDRGVEPPEEETAEAPPPTQELFGNWQRGDEHHGLWLPPSA